MSTAGRSYPGSRPFKNSPAQIVFEQLDLTGDRRLRNVTALGRAADAAFLKDRQKQAQFVDHAGKSDRNPASRQSSTGIIRWRLTNINVERSKPNNKQQPMKKGNADMKLKKDTEITPRLTRRGRTTVQFLAALIAAGSLAGSGTFAQSAKDIRGASPYVEIKDEPAPKLIVDQPLPEGLAIGLVWIQYRVENLRIAPVIGEGATKVSPRVGHLHVTVDDRLHSRRHFPRLVVG